MNPAEAVQLAAYIQSHFPQQPINEFTPEALGELLAPYSLESCREAVLTRALRLQKDDGQKWCAPTDVYAEVRRIRAKAIASDEPIPMPADHDPDDTAAHIRLLVAGRQAQIEGRELPQPRGLVRGNIAALGGPMRRVNELDDDERARLAERSREVRAEALRDLAAREAAAKAVEETKPGPVFACDMGEPACGKQATRVSADGRRPVCDDHSREPQPTTTEETPA